MKNTEYILYLDLDGVLVDFNGGYRKLSNGKTIQETNDEEGERAARAKYLAAGEEFWANLDWIRGGQELWNAAKNLFEHVAILSSAGTTDAERGKMVDAGKRRWLQKNIPDMNQSNVFIVLGKHNKQKYASKLGILVDDVRVTIDQWNKAGGFGILHNATHFKRTIEELEDISRPFSLAEIAKRFLHWYL